MPAIIKQNTNDYEVKNLGIVKFENKSNLFQYVETISVGDSVHRNIEKTDLHFSFYDITFNSKESYEELEQDCLRFAEQISNKKCQINESAIGYITTIRVGVVPKSIWNIG